MTNLQKLTLEKIREAIPRFDYYGHPESHEIKKWQVRETNYSHIVLYVETGCKEDDGTMAEIFCRKRRQIFIGSRGGCTAYTYSKRLKRLIMVEGFFDCMNRGYEE